MAHTNYVEGCSMIRPPLLETEGFCYWKQRFETYVKSKDIDVWDIIEDEDYIPTRINMKTKEEEIIVIKEMSSDEKKQMSKNFEAKLIL